MSTEHTTDTAGRPATQSAEPKGTPSRGHRDRPRSWPVPAALVALSAIPLTVGTLRLVQLAGGPAIMPADHRFAGFPLPLALHIVGPPSTPWSARSSSCPGSVAATRAGIGEPDGFWRSPGWWWPGRPYG